MLSNDVEQESCEALLLTPKGRVIAPLRVWRRAPDDFLLLTEPELGERVRAALLRLRFAAKCEIELEEHVSTVLFDEEADGIPNDDYGRPAVEVLDADVEATVGDEELELLRIRAGTPRYGREIDERILPAEAGLDVRAISFEKGCYPGQEPVARLRYRGHVNRALRLLELEGTELPEYDTEVRHGERVVGRVTSAVRGDGRVLALGYVRADVPQEAALLVGKSSARMRPA
jgi:tRNA-modifying protein YgfZ